MFRCPLISVEEGGSLVISFNTWFLAGPVNMARDGGPRETQGELGYMFAVKETETSAITVRRCYCPNVHTGILHINHTPQVLESSMASELYF